MNMQRSISLSLAGAAALALFGMATVATAQTTAPQPTTRQVPPPPPATTTATPAQPAQPMPAPPQTPPLPPANQAPPAQPATPMATPPQQGTTGQFYQGTETTAKYPLPDSNGGTLTVNAGMPAKVRSYGPPPAFATLDTNHDGRIGETEAQAYPPLDGDFLYASHGGRSISRGQYGKWVNGQH